MRLDNDATNPQSLFSMPPTTLINDGRDTIVSGCAQKDLVDGPC